MCDLMREWLIMGVKAHRALLLLGLLLIFSAPAGLAAPGDLVFERESEGASVPPSIFPHWLHRVRYRCYVCHPSIFEMRQGASEITMELIKDGESCGVCHNGRIAFMPSFENCNLCHRPPEE